MNDCGDEGASKHAAVAEFDEPSRPRQEVARDRSQTRDDGAVTAQLEA